MTNKDVVHAFINNDASYCSSTGSLHGKQGSLYSYNTLIAIKFLCGLKEVCLIDDDKYSATTSRHKRLLIREINIPYGLIPFKIFNLLGIRNIQKIKMIDMHADDFLFSYCIDKKIKVYRIRTVFAENNTEKSVILVTNELPQSMQNPQRRRIII